MISIVYESRAERKRCHRNGGCLASAAVSHKSYVGVRMRTWCMQLIAKALSNCPEFLNHAYCTSHRIRVTERERESECERETDVLVRRSQTFVYLMKRPTSGAFLDSGCSLMHDMVIKKKKISPCPLSDRPVYNANWFAFAGNCLSRSCNTRIEPTDYSLIDSNSYVWVCSDYIRFQHFIKNSNCQGC